MSQNKNHNWRHLALFQLCFFANYLFLPAPITWLNILSLVSIKNLLNRKAIIVLSTCLTMGLVYMVIHTENGVSMVDYLRSSMFNFLLIVNSLLIWKYIRHTQIDFPKAYSFSIYFGFVLFLMAAVMLLFSAEEVLWSVHDFVGDGTHQLFRFKGLAYEPSHFAFCLAPLAIFAVFSWTHSSKQQRLHLIIMVLIPIIFTVSFGFFTAFILSLGLSVVLAYLIFRHYNKKLLYSMLIGLGAIVISCAAVDSVQKRVTLIVEGKDTSINGRTTEAFTLAYRCAKEKSVWFGIGPGQIKIVGEKIIRPFYQEKDFEGYTKENWPKLSIPNNMAETLAIYGILGVLFKVLIQISLFVKFKLYGNYFNLTLFLFTFIYQFMGSFINSTAELILWIFALAPMFTEFQIKQPSKP